MTLKLTKAKPFGWYPQRVNHEYMTLLAKIVYLLIQGNSLWGLNPEYLSLQLTSSLQITKLHHDG